LTYSNWQTKTPQDLLDSRMVLEKQLHFVTDHLPVFCLSLSNSQMKAPAFYSKICLFLKHLTLSIQEDQIIESCFDWLINEDQ
jgi:hypothetical protein